MSKKIRNRQRSAKIAGILIGVIIVVTTMLSLLAPQLGNNSSSSSGDSTFSTPEPTKLIIPTPDPDPQIDGALPYLHSTGFFQAFRPAGNDWEVYETQETNTPPYSGVIMQNRNWLAVIHSYLRQGVEYDTLEALSENYWTESEFNDNWGNYDSWSEVRREIVDDRLIIDFDLALDGNTYLGRTTSWVENNFLYVSRLVVPSNNPALRDLLFEKATPGLIGLHDLQILPQTWPVYVDQADGFAFKHPSGWSMIAGGTGRPTTFRIPSGQVRVMVEAEQAVNLAEDAEQWIIGHEQNVTILASAPIEHEMGTGYQVAYSYQDTAGDLHSGLVVLLIGLNNALYIANAQIETPDVNLLEIDETVSALNYEVARALTEGFIVLPGALVETPAE